MVLYSGLAENEDAGDMVNLAEAAMKKGYQVNIFLCGNGVYISRSKSASRPDNSISVSLVSYLEAYKVGGRLKDLARMGANIASLSLSEHARGIDALPLQKGLRNGNIAHTFCDFLLGSDVFLVFGH